MRVWKRLFRGNLLGNPVIFRHGRQHRFAWRHVEGARVAATVVGVHEDGTVDLLLLVPEASWPTWVYRVECGEGPGQFSPIGNRW